MVQEENEILLDKVSSTLTINVIVYFPIFYFMHEIYA